MKYIFSLLLLVLGFILPAKAQPIALTVIATTPAKEGTPTANGVFTINLADPAPAGGLVVTYNLGGTATNPAHYTLTAGTNITAITATTFTVDAGQMSATINVVPVNDFATNAARTVIMTIPSSPPDYTTNAATETATVNIADDDNLFTVASSGTPTENGATATFTFTRATSSVGDIVVNFTVGGTAALTTHYTVGGATSYTATTGTVTILNGQNTATLTVTPINDFTINAARTVILTVVPSGVPNYTIGAANSATATIADFVTNITIAAGVNAREGTPAVNGTFTFTLGTAAPAGGLVVNYTMSGTATSPANYSLTAGTNIAAITATTFTIAAGQTTATVNVVPINDFAINGATPTIIMTLGANPTYNIVGVADATINLLDDNNLVTVTAAGSPSENGTTGTFTFTRATSTTGNLVVHFTVGGAAAFPAKYSVSGATSFTVTTGTITILNGQTSAILTLTPINDFITSPPSRDVTVSLVAATPTPTYTIAATNNSALLNIADVATDIGVTLGNNAQEGTPAVDGVFTFTLSQAAPAGGLTVNYTLGGTATLTTHYTVAAGTNASSLTATTFVIAAGATSATLRIVPINNYAENAARTVICNIGAGSYNIATGAATLNINDDNLRVSLASSGTPSENGATGTFTFTRTNTSGLLLVPFTVGGTATYNTHYTITTTSPSSYSATNGTIVFADGQASVTITINPINDNLINAARSVILTLSNNMTFTVANAPNNSATLNIADATSPEVSIGFLGAPNEAGTIGAFVFSRTASTALALTVRFTLTGTATIGTNYTITNAILVSGSTYEVTIPAGSATRNVIINPSNDFTLTPGGRTVIATAITFMPQAYNLSPTAFTETLTIADDPNPITLTVSPTNIAENGGSFVTYTFSRGAATTGNLFVNFNVNGTAIYNAAGSSQPNYFQSTFFPLSWNVANGATTGNGFIVIPNGQTSASFRVHPVDDGLASGDKTVTVALNSGSYTVSATNSATATILDASSSPLVGISAISPIVDGGNSTITITRGGNFIFPVTVNFTVLGIAAGTYNLTNTSAMGNITMPTFNAMTGTGSFVFDIGTAKVATLNLNVLNDYIASNTPRNAVIQLTSASFTIPAIGTFPLILNPSNATVVVNDDPNPIAVQKISDADEANPAVGIIRFSRGAVTAGVTVVRFGIDRNNGNSTLATHYTVSGATFLSSDANYHYYTANIPNGSTTTDVNITGINDLVISPARFARIVVLQNIPNYTVALSPNNTTDINITEDPNVVGITVPASPQASEVGPTSGIFTISRNIATASPLVVDFDIDNVGLTNPAALTTHYTVTTQAGLTYTGTGGSVTIPAGATSVNITINPINDFATTTPDRQFRLRLKPSANYRIGTTATNAVMTITDDSSIISIQKIGADPTKSGSVVGKFRVSRSSFVGRPAQTIAFTVAGTATFSAHYSQVGAASYNTLNGQITIPAGVASADIDITAVNDFAIQTMPRNIQIALSSGSYIVSTTLNTATMDIIDNNNIVSIVADTPNTPAEAGAMGTPVATSFTFTRTNGSNVNPLNVNFAITGSAIATTHYTLSGAGIVLNGTSQGTITIPAGQNSVVLTLTPINDFTVNANRNVFFTLTSTTPQTYTIINTTANTATCTIADDSNEVAIAAVAPNTPAEAGMTGMPVATSYTFTRSGGSNIAALNVDFSISGDAIVGTHYTLSNAGITLSGTTQGTVTIPAGQNNVTLTLTPINDFLVNTNRNVVFTVSQKTPQTYTVAVAPNNRASSSIIDDNNTVSIAPVAPNTPAESNMAGTPVPTSYTFTRANGSTIAPLNIDFSISGDAVVGTHYTLSGASIVLNGTTQGTVTILAGQTTATLTLTPINDFQTNLNRNAVFTILQKTPQTYTVAVAPNNSASSSIIDDNSTISIAPVVPNTPAEANMAGMPVPTGYTFTRANGSTTNALNVDFAISGDAIVNTHYTLSGASIALSGTTQGTVTIPAGQASVTLTLTPINDFLVNTNRNVVFTVSQKTPQTYTVAVAPNNRASSSIIDDNNTVSIAPVAPNTPAEADMAGIPVPTSYTFTRANGSTIAPLNIDFSISGDAVVGTHYTLSGAGIVLNGTTQGTVTIPAGQTTATLILTPINDFQTNPNRNAVFTILQKTPQTYTVAVAPNNSASSSIIDDNSTISVAPVAPNTPAEADMAGMPVPTSFTFTRANGSTTNALNIDFAISGDAIVNTHYTLSGASIALTGTTQGTVTIPAGQASVTLTLTPINDFLVNANRSAVFTILQKTPQTYTVATAPNNRASTFIIDDNSTISIASVAPNTPAEAGMTGMPVPTSFTFTRANGSTIAALNVDFSIAGDAVVNTHYTLTGASIVVAGTTQGTVTIPAGQTSVTLTLTPINDFLVNANRNVSFTILQKNPQTYNIASAPNNSANTVILDDNNEVSVIAVAPNMPRESGMDNNPVPTSFTFTRANGSTIAALQVDFSLGGSAVANTHYTLSGGGVSVNATNTQATITIPAGQNSVTVILTPINDFQINTNRNVVFSLLTKNPQTYTVATGMTAAASTVIINDPNTVSITSAGTPTEDMQTATFTFTRSDNKTTPLTVAFTVGGTATFGTHYTVTGAASYNATTGTITIPANQTSATLTITTINDFITNPNRTVILTVVNTTPAASYIVATPPNNQVAVTIVDDVNAVRITQTGIANESGTTAKFTISRNTASASPLTVNFDVLGTSTATLATHYTVTGAATYTATNGTATIPAGATSVDITITPIDDNIINVSRNIILQLTLTTPLTYQLSAVASETTATVIIANDDPQVTVALGNDAQETNRVAGKFMLNFNAAPTANTTINYTLTGTAAGTRYAVSGGANIVGTPTTTSAVVAAGSTTAELIITPIDNLTIDPSQTIILTLQPSTVAPTPDYFINTATPATMQIVDNDVTVACGTPVATTWTGVQTANLNYTANTAGQAIEFSITNINLAGTDKISIYNGAAFPTDNAQLIAEFTGNTVPPIFTSIAETISVVITQADAGSVVEYSINCVPQTPKVNCGSPTATLYSIGSITTPYAPNSRIIRTFQSSSFASGNGAISATFNRFDVEASYDFIRVYDGLDTLAPLLGEFHNNQLPTQTLQTSLGNTAGALTFYFRSDGTVERAGFEVAMTCGTTVVAPTVFDPDVFALTELENAYGMGWDLMNPTNIDGVVWNQEPVRRVVSINLSGRGLMGDLPPDFAFITADDGRMARLQSLDLSNNGITGTIPSTFGRLKVTNLNLSNNSLEGGIPFEFQNLSNLVTLNLSSNFLNDVTNFDALEFLQYLATVDLSNNQFNAPLPISLLNIPQLSNLNLSVNQFSGNLPKELRDMRSIKVLNLSGNNLTGTMTVNGAGLSLFDSQFFLEDLNLSRNQLTGKIPGDMTKTLKFLNLSDNKFTGNLDSLYFLSGLINLELQKNELAGNLPANLHEISFAVNINLANNKFTGTIPSWSKFALIRTLDLSFNQLSGAVPASLNNITSLTTLALNDNQLRDLPTLTALTNIKSLNVYNNRVTFEDLEPNVSIPNFNAAAYSPQAAINDTVRISTSIGALITMKTNTAGTANLYRWKKGNLPIKSQAVLNDSIYAITSVVIEDAGLYSCDVTSNIVKGLTIVRNPIILNVGNPRVNVTDSLALVALYRSAGGRNWDNRWDLLLPVRTWYGVTLDIDRVIFLRLNDNKLEGTITDSLRLLSRLEELNLRKNRLSSKISAELGQLTNLVRFDLSGNRLTGEIPTTLGTLAKLTYMDLSENLLEGAIPATLTSLSKLKTLLLNDNAFSAMPNFTSITTLERLGVENNRLTFGDFEPNQSLISKTNFRFTYSPQAQINDARTIQAVFATPLTLNTQTSGTANTYQWLKSNAVIANAPNNTNFRINSLSYSDSGAYTCRVTNMLVPNLTLVRRALTVVVNPPALLATDSLALVDLYNSTNGANWDKKWDLTQPMDTWFGVVLDKSIGRVIRLLLSNNRLSGRISTSIGNLTKLKELNIRANPDLNGTIPTTIGNLIELEDLNLRGNRLTGTIPTELGRLVNLKTLALDNNQLSGVIPSALGSLQNLSVLFLNNNRLTGSLPNEINNLRLLQELYLNDNLLDRLIALPNLSVLGTLTVQNNNLGFESLESLIRIASFQYSPQLPRPAFDSTFISGRNYSLNTRAGGTQNRYLWKNDLNNQTVTTPIYSFTNILPQSTGRYTCDVTSAIVPNLTITYTYNIRVVPDVPRVTVPLPYCIGNNSVTLTVQDPVQAPFTQWIYFNTEKNRYDTLSPLQRSLTYKPRTTIGVDTVYATTIVRNVPSSSTNRILLYLRPEIRNIGGVLTVIDNNSPNNKYQWLLFESPLQGATAKTLTPTQRGLYRVNLITEDGCSASSDTLRFGTVTSTEDQVLKNNLTISPNPTSDNLELVLDNDYVGNTEIVITDVLGRVIWQQKTEKFEVKLAKTIAVENWASGTYYLKLQTNKGFAVKRFVKQ